MVKHLDFLMIISRHALISSLSPEQSKSIIRFILRALMSPVISSGTWCQTDVWMTSALLSGNSPYTKLWKLADCNLYCLHIDNTDKYQNGQII